MNDLLDSPLSSPRSQRYFRLWVACIWGGLVAVGFLFRSAHWPFAAELILGGSAGLCAYATSAFIRLRGKHPLNTVCALASWIWLGFLLRGMLFAGGYPFNEMGMLFYAGVFVPVFAIHVMINSMKARR